MCGGRDIVPVEYRYIDIIWLDNLVMNFILLWTTSKVSKDHTAQWRLWIASCIGATYAIFLVVSGFIILNRLSIKIILSICMLLISFKFTTCGRLLKLLGVFYGATFAFGGAAFGLYYFTDDILSIGNGVFYIKNFPIKILFMSSTLLIILICTIWPKIRRKWISDTLVYRINIKYNGMSIILDALLDTGNALYDPITQNPVIIVEYTKIRETLPEAIRDIFKNNRELDMDYVVKALANSNFAERFRLIPYYAIGKPGGLLIGFKPDEVLISMADHWRENRDIIIAVYNDRLSMDEQYHALIHPEILSA